MIVIHCGQCNVRFPGSYEFKIYLKKKKKGKKKTYQYILHLVMLLDFSKGGIFPL